MCLPDNILVLASLLGGIGNPGARNNRCVLPISESKFWHQPLTAITLCQSPDPPGARGCQN